MREDTYVEVFELDLLESTAPALIRRRSSRSLPSNRDRTTDCSANVDQAIEVIPPTVGFFVNSGSMPATSALLVAIDVAGSIATGSGKLGWGRLPYSSAPSSCTWPGGPRGPSTGVGPGSFIVRTIASSHRGHYIDARSSTFAHRPHALHYAFRNAHRFPRSVIGHAVTDEDGHIAVSEFDHDYHLG